MDEFYSEIVDMILKGEIIDKKSLHKIKRHLCSRYRMAKVPSDADILARIPEEERERVEVLMRTKAVRSISGVGVVAAMTSPAKCPHGRCRYCPGGVDSGTAQSYTGREPASLRASMNDFDAFRQVSARLEQLRITGHPIDKVDLIIMGGTFTAREPEFQDDFVKGCFDAMNGTVAENLEKAHKLNEDAKSRCIGLTIETRPDWFREEHVNRALAQGATRVELGVQCVFDEALERMERGHGIAESKIATKLARDAGMKVGYHLMPGMPGVTREMDLQSFQRVFGDPELRPDMLKIYPTLVIKGTELYGEWLAKKYEPPSTEDMVGILSEAKSHFPPWVRVQRIQRDIPVQLIEAGVKKSNLRQLVQEHMAADNRQCRCIRCREVGHRQLKGDEVNPGALEMKEETYEASGGTEYFVTMEDTENDILLAYIRLRNPGDPWRPEMKNASVIREMKVIGQLVPVGKKAPPMAWQHKGMGKKLLERAEEIAASEFESLKLLVMSGVGARNYYRSFGYELDGPYMGKTL
jgi:elongator complex protein 3